jgi:hypothetical protein
MPNWLKYVLSASSGFLTVFSGAKVSGLSTGGSAIAGAISAATALGNLQVSSPGDKVVLQQNEGRSYLVQNSKDASSKF